MSSGVLIEHSVVKESLTTAAEAVAADEEDIEALEKMAKEIENRKKGTQDERS